jgi:hypothetical protein
MTSGPVHGVPAPRQGRCWPASSKNRSKGSAVAVAAAAVVGALVREALEAAGMTAAVVADMATAHRHRDIMVDHLRLDNMAEDHQDISVAVVRRHPGHRAISEDVALLHRAKAFLAAAVLVAPLEDEASAAEVRPMATGEVVVDRAGEDMVVEEDSAAEEADGSRAMGANK